MLFGIFSRTAKLWHTYLITYGDLILIAEAWQPICRNYPNLVRTEKWLFSRLLYRVKKLFLEIVRVKLRSRKNIFSRRSALN